MALSPKLNRLGKTENEDCHHRFRSTASSLRPQTEQARRVGAQPGHERRNHTLARFRPINSTSQKTVTAVGAPPRPRSDDEKTGPMALGGTRSVCRTRLLQAVSFTGPKTPAPASASTARVGGFTCGMLTVSLYKIISPRCCLTTWSSGPAPAAVPGLAPGQAVLSFRQARAVCLHGPLTANVRRRTHRHMRALQE